MLMNNGKSVDGTYVLSDEAAASCHDPKLSCSGALDSRRVVHGAIQKHWGQHALYGHSGTNLSGPSMLLWCPEERL